MKWIGAPFVYHQSHKEKEPCLGGQSPETGFFCSGYVKFVLDQIGYQLEPEHIGHVNEFFDHRIGRNLHLGLQEEGDLVFFSKEGIYPSHMGIMLNDRYYIHAIGESIHKVTVTRLMARKIIHKPTFDQAGKIIKPCFNHNPIGFKRLAKPGYRWYQASLGEIQLDR